MVDTVTKDKQLENRLELSGAILRNHGCNVCGSIFSCDICTEAFIETRGTKYPAIWGGEHMVWNKDHSKAVYICPKCRKEAS